MVKTYSDRATSLKPIPIEEKTLLSMGKIIRAYAEMEDIATLFLAHLVRLKEAEVLVLLGRTNMSTKLLSIATITKALGGDAEKVFSQTFDTDAFRSLTTCRNAIAHGVYFGVTDVVDYAFRLTNQVSAIVGTRLAYETISWSPEAFRKFAKIAEEGVIGIELALGLKSLRSDRLQRGLAPHRKSQPVRPPSAKPVRQPRPSGQ